MTTEARQQFDAWFDDGPYGNCDAYIVDRMWAAWQAAIARGRLSGLQQAAELIEDVARISEESADYGSDFRPIMGLRRMAAAIREKIAEVTGEKR